MADLDLLKAHNLIHRHMHRHGNMEHQHLHAHDDGHVHDHGELHTHEREESVHKISDIKPVNKVIEK